MQGSPSKRHQYHAPQAASTCAGCSCPLVSLPDAILRQIVLQIQDQRSLTAMADSCTALRAAVFAHAEALELLLKMGMKHKSSALFAALTSRPPTDSVQLTLGSAEYPSVMKEFPEALTGVLSDWGTCAAVKVLKFCSVNFNKWSPQLSAMVAHHFPNLQALEFSYCSAAFRDVLGLLEQCPGVTDLSLPHMYINGEQYATAEQLWVLGRLQGLTLNTGWLGLGATVVSDAVQHVTSLKRLDLRNCKECMLPSLLHLTQLESLSLGMDETVDNCCYTDCCALPKVVRRLKHLHTLHIPDCPVFGNRILDALLEEAPQLTNLSVKSFNCIYASRANAPCRWRSLRIGEVKDIWHFHNLPLTSVTQELVISELVISESHVGPGSPAQFDASDDAHSWYWHGHQFNAEDSDEEQQEVDDGSEHGEEDGSDEGQEHGLEAGSEHGEEDGVDQEGGEGEGEEGDKEGDHSSQQGAEGPARGSGTEDDEVSDQEEESEEQSEEQRVHAQFQAIKMVLHSCQVTPVIEKLVITVQDQDETAEGAVVAEQDDNKESKRKNSTWSLVKLLSLAQPLVAFSQRLRVNNRRSNGCDWSGADVEAIVDAFKDTSLTGLMFAYCHIVGPCFWSALTTAVRAIPTLQSVTFMNVCLNQENLQRLQGMREALSGRALHVRLRWSYKCHECRGCPWNKSGDKWCPASLLEELDSSVTLTTEDESHRPQALWQRKYN